MGVSMTKRARRKVARIYVNARREKQGLPSIAILSSEGKQWCSKVEVKNCILVTNGKKLSNGITSYFKCFLDDIKIVL